MSTSKQEEVLHFDPAGQERIATWLAGEAPAHFLATSWADMAMARVFRYGEAKNVHPILLRLVREQDDGRSLLATMLINGTKRLFRSAVLHVLNNRRTEFPAQCGPVMDELRNVLHAVTSKEYQKNRLSSCSRSSCITHEDLQEDNLQLHYDQNYEVQYNQIIEQYCYQPYPYDLVPVLTPPTAMNNPLSLRKDPLVLRLTLEEKTEILEMAMDKRGGWRLQDCMREGYGWAEDTEAIFDALFHTNLLKEQDGPLETTFLNVAMHKEGNFVAQALVEVMSNAGKAVASSSSLPSSNQSDLWRKKLEHLMDTLMNPASAGAAEDEHPLLKLALNDKGLRVVLRLFEGVHWDSPAKKKVGGYFVQQERISFVLFILYFS